MEPSSLLAPLLPYLLKGGVELAKSAAGEPGEKLREITLSAILESSRS